MYEEEEEKENKEKEKKEESKSQKERKRESGPLAERENAAKYFFGYIFSRK